MPFGGRQPGAGRPKGSVNKATRELREAAAAQGIMPAELMLKNMRYFDREAELELSRQMRKRVADRDFARCHSLMDKAEACAVDCGQFYHPKLAALAAMRPPDPTATSLEQMILGMSSLPANQNVDPPAATPLIEGSLAEAVKAAE